MEGGPVDIDGLLTTVFLTGVFFLVAVFFLAAGILTGDMRIMLYDYIYASQ